MAKHPRLIASAAVTAVFCLASYAERVPAAAQAAPASQPFEAVASLLPSKCDFCHGREREPHRSGFYTGSYEALLDGAFKNGRFQPVILKADAQNSPLVLSIEGRREPRMPYHRDPLSPPQIKAFRDWIDAGAPRAASTYEEHELSLPHVSVDPLTHAFWLSCASREDGLNVSKRIKVMDEPSGAIVVYDWPGGGEGNETFDRHGRWDQWRVSLPPSVKGPVTVQLLIAGSNFTRSGPDTGRDPADGSVFVIDSRKTASNDLDEIAAAVLTPSPPPHRIVELKFRTLTDADLTLDVFPSRSDTAVIHREERDLPAGPNSITWPIAQPQPRPAAGWYEARFRFKARRPGTRQPDIGMTFELKP